ncbi:MAG: hypothetical protein ACLSFJ_00345 [Holdemania filiformis]
MILITVRSRCALVDTRQDHADLSDEYGLMPAEMRQVAAYFGAEVPSGGSG